MTRTKSTCLALAAILFAPMAANADPILVGPTDGATGILGLDIGGTLYDVTFCPSGQDYFDCYSNGSPEFLGDISGAELARNAVANFLQAMLAEQIAATAEYVFVPFAELGGGIIRMAYAGSNDSALPWDAGVIAFGSTTVSSSCCSNTSWAMFNTVSVPEPGTLALFGIGLVGLGLTRRRRTA